MQVFSATVFNTAHTPLGRVDIPLAKFGWDAAELDEWYPLERFERLRAGGRLGSVHLRLKIGKVVRRLNRQSTSMASDIDTEREIKDGGDEPPQCRDLEPNYFRVTVHRVRGFSSAG